MSRPRILAFSVFFFIFVLFWNPASAQPVSSGLILVSGNGQVVWEQFRTTVPMIVQARDNAGNPIANLPVTWTVSKGQGTLISSEPRTDAKGFASTDFVGSGLPAGYSFASHTITASTSVGNVNFAITSILNRLGNGGIGPMPLVQVLAPPQENRNITGRAGQTIPGFQVQVVALAGPQQGFPIQNVGMRIVDGIEPSNPAPAACAGTPLTNAQGFGTCNLVLTGAPGLYTIAASVGDFVITPNAFLTITPSQACSFSLTPSSANVPTAGIVGSVAVAGTASCGWTASSNVNWISITAGFSGTGSGSVSYSVSPNAGIPRIGTLNIAGQTFTVNQLAPGSGAALVFTTGATLPSAVTGSGYSANIGANGGTQPYTFSVPNGLPGGLAINAGTGALTGTAPALGNYSFPVTVRDNANQSLTQTFALPVVSTSSGANPTISNGSFPNGTAGTAYSEMLTSVGGCSNPFSPAPVFTVTSGTLPPGLTLQGPRNDRTSVIAGTPTTNGQYAFNLQVTDTCARSGTGGFVLTIGAGGGPNPNPNPNPGTGPLSLSPNQLQFTLQQGASSQTQAVGVSGNSALGFIAQAQILSGSLTWLSVSPTGGSTPANISVSASASGLPPGVYSGAINVIPAGSTFGAVTVPVTLRVQPPPTVSPLPSSLLFLYQPGTSPTGPQSVNIASTGAGFDFQVSGTTESGVNWLFVTPSTGSTPGVLSVSVNPLGLVPATYRGSVIIIPSNPSVPPLTIPVTLSISQSGPAITALVNAASFSPGPISPGEFVTIFGTNLGPSSLIQARRNSAGFLETFTADTRVYFDNTPAAIIYSSERQVSVIVPYSVYGRAFARIEVEYRGQRSSPLDLRVVDSAPALFTLSTSQAAAVNEDGNTNSAQAGADAGSVIALYATGEGQTDPQGVDGRFMDAILARPLLPVTVQIDGQDAELLYAGSAPGLPAGMIQINARIPLGVTRGIPVTVIVTIGRTTTQAGITIFVK